MGEGRPADVGTARPTLGTQGPTTTGSDLFAQLCHAATGYLVVATNLADEITVFSPGAERLLGYTADEVVGRATPVLFHDPAEVAARAADLGVRPGREVLLHGVTPGTSVTAPWTLVRRDGERLPVSLTVSAVTDTAGEVTGWLRMAHDRSGELRVAEQREHVTRDLRRLFHNSPVPTLIAGARDARVRLVNRAAADALGTSPDDLVGRTTTEIGFWRDLVSRDEVVERIRAEGRVRDVQMEVERPGGSRTLVASLESLDFEGTPCVIGTFVDVTAHEEAEEALRESEERLRQFADHVDVGFFLRDVDPFRFVYVNEQLARIYGVPLARILDDPPSVFAHVHPDDVDLLRATIRRAEESGEPQQMEYRLRREDTGERWVRVRLSPVSRGDGPPTRIAGTAEDVTAEKAAAEALVAARREAEQANVAKSEFLSRMSHELRTPLNAIIGFSQLLQMDPLSPEQAEAVEHVLLGGRHLLELINEVLDISRIESGRLRLSLEPVRLADVLEESLALVRPQAEELGVRLPADGAGAGDLHVAADRQRLTQVLLNLLSNAVKYNTRDGEVRLSVTDSETDVDVAVEDTGRGIAPDRLDDLFTPFDRLGAEQTGVEGTGLGLALTQRLVALMGGGLRVDSTLGTGTTFTVTLDRCAPPGDDDVAAPAPVRSRVPGPPRRVLYVEDNQANVRLVERVLAGLGHVDLHVATSGRAALEAVSQARPDVVLLDVDLPDLDGHEVLVRLRAEPETRALPVVVVSADASPGLRRRLADAGAHAHLTKPFDVTALLRVVDAQLLPAPEPR